MEGITKRNKAEFDKSISLALKMSRPGYISKVESSKASLWERQRPFLDQLDIELTERCNNNCIHCCINLPADDSSAKERELSAEEIKNILKEAVSLGCISVRYTGGEPLLREDFEELYVFTRKSGLKVLLFTNAVLITPRLAKLFAEIPPLEKIEITLYGMKKSSYEAVTRVRGSFEASQRGIRLLRESRIPFIVKGAILPQNKGEIAELEKWSATIPWMGDPPAYSIFLDLRGRRDLEKNTLIRSLRLSPQEGLRILTRRKAAYLKDMKKVCSRFMWPPGDKLFSCGFSHGGCVDSYGKFQPCMMLRCPDCSYDLRRGEKVLRSMPQFQSDRRGAGVAPRGQGLGTAKDKRALKDALVSFFPALRRMKAKDRVYLATCAKCFLKGICEQCPAKSWMEHGTLDTPVEYYCQIAHVQARYLGLVKDGEPAWEVKDWKERVRKFTGRL